MVSPVRIIRPDQVQGDDPVSQKLSVAQVLNDTLVDPKSYYHGIVLRELLLLDTGKPSGGRIQEIQNVLSVLSGLMDLADKTTK